MPFEFSMPKPAEMQGEIMGEMSVQSELEQLRAERAKLIERERQIMELVGATKPERILHDIRNILNERSLLRALCEKM